MHRGMSGRQGVELALVVWPRVVWRVAYSHRTVV